MINRKSENGNLEKGNDGMIDNIDGNNKALEDAIKNAEQAKARLAVLWGLFLSGNYVFMTLVITSRICP